MTKRFYHSQWGWGTVVHEDEKFYLMDFDCGAYYWVYKTEVK
jgi:hypothetical protein